MKQTTCLSTLLLLPTKWLATKSIQVLPHPPIPLTERRQTSFCSGRWRRRWLASNWPRGASKMPGKRTIAKDNFAINFRRWFEQCKNCIQVCGDYVKNNWKINAFLTLMVVFLLSFSSLILIPPCKCKKDTNKQQYPGQAPKPFHAVLNL